MLYAQETATKKVYKLVGRKNFDFVIEDNQGNQTTIRSRVFENTFDVFTDKPRLYRLGRSGNKTHYGHGMCGGTRIRQNQFTSNEFGIPTCKKCLEHREHFERRAKELCSELERLFLEDQDNG